MSKVFKRVFQDKQSFRFSVEVLRALNIDQHVSDCAFVSLKKRRKTYQTEMVLPDEHGGLSWNQVLEVSVSLFKDKSNQIWEPKRYNVELVSSSGVKMISKLDFSHFGSLREGEGVTETLPLEIRDFFRKGSGSGDPKRLNDEYECSSPVAQSVGSGSSGKPVLFLKITRLSFDDDAAISMNESERESAMFTSSSMSKSSRAAKSFTNLSLAENPVNASERFGKPFSNEPNTLPMVAERQRQNSNMEDDRTPSPTSIPRHMRPRMSIVSRVLGSDHEEFHQRHDSLEYDHRMPKEVKKFAESLSTASPDIFSIPKTHADP